MRVMDGSDAEMSYAELEALVDPSRRLSPPATEIIGLPAQRVRDFVCRYLTDPAEIDDLVEEILGACVSDFSRCQPGLRSEQWVMDVAARVVSERWRHLDPTDQEAV